MNIYQRLESKGWRRVSGTSRNDFYRKGKWVCIVPASINFDIKFVRVKSRTVRFKFNEASLTTLDNLTGNSNLTKITLTNGKEIFIPKEVQNG